MNFNFILKHGSARPFIFIPIMNYFKLKQNMLNSFFGFLLSLRFVLLFLVSISLAPVPVYSADYFWVGGTGSWNDLTHWATSSGGTTKHTIIPSVLDNVIFDVNSFTAGGQIVTLNQEAFCKDFKWDGVTNNPTFTGAGFTLNVDGKFLAMGAPFTFNHVNGNLNIGGDFLVDGSNMSFTKNSGNMIIGGKFDIKNVSTMFFTRSGTIQVNGGAMSFTDATLSSFTASGITIATGNLTFTNSKTTGNFVGGTVNLINGGITIPSWSGGNFSTSSITMTGSLILNAWTSGSLTTGNVNSSAGKILLEGWSSANGISMGAVNLSSAANVGGFEFKNSVMPSFSSSSISITNGNLTFTNSKTTGNFIGGTVTLNNGEISIPSWNGGNFSTSSITMTGSLVLNAWTSGNLTTGNVNSSAGKILIEDWNAGFVSMGNVTLGSAVNVGGFEFKNSTMTSFGSNNISITNGNLTFTNSKTTGNFTTGTISLPNGGLSIPAWTGGNFSTSNVSLSGNLSISNWSSGTLTIGTISSASGQVLIDNKTAGNTNILNLNLTNGNFQLTNSSGWTMSINNSYTSSIVGGNFLIENSPINFSMGYYHSLTVNGNFSILNGATTFTNNSTLSVRGNFTLNSACTFNQSDYVIFTSNTLGKTITSAGKQFANVRFNGSGGEWILQDNFKVTGTTEHYTGIFRSNGKSVDYGVVFNGDDYGTVKTLDYTGTDTVRVQYQYRLNPNASTILTTGGAVLLLQTSVATEMVLEGGGKTFGTLVINQLNNSTSANYILFQDNNNIFGDVIVKIANRAYLYFNSSNNTFGNVSIHYSGTTVTSVNESLIYGTNTFGNFTMTTAGLQPRLYCDQNNTLGIVSLPPGSQWRIANGRTQSLKGLLANGDCQRIIYIYGSSSTATITDTDGGTNTLDFVRLERLNFSGAGTTWNATNTLDVTSTTGINVTPPATKTYYWIGGTGNWNDLTKWSLSSGGTAAGCLPTRVDHVVFDNNSFPGSNQTVNLNVAAEIINMTWTSGVNASPNFSGSQSLIINGDLNIAGTMDWVLTGGLTLRESIILNSGVNWSHNNLVTFSGTTSGHTIDMAGKTFSYIVYFDNPGNSSSGSWTLASNFSVSTSYYTEFRDAGFISNGFSVNFGDYFSASSDVPKVLDFTGTDTVRVQRHWNMLTGVNASLTMGQAVLLLRQPSGLTNTIEFYGGAKTYHDVVIDALNTNTANSILLSHTGTVLRDFYIRLSGPQNLNWQQAFTSRNVSVLYFSNNTFYVPSFQISGNHTMSSLKFSTNFVQPSLYLYNNNTIDTLQLHHGMTTYFGANQTQTLKSLTADGICSRRISLYSTSSGTQATLSDLTGTNTVDQLYMRDIKAQGGAVWIADDVVNEGNNTGWTLNPLSVQSYYWIGGTGNWSDSTKWSFSSGGAPANCLPSRQDHVVFDNNSFPGSNQTVTLNIHAEISNMTWTSGVNASPNFSGSQNLIINGDLTISGTMDWILNGGLTLRKSIVLSSGVNWSHTNFVTFSGTTSGNTINMAGKTFSNAVLFDNPGNSASGSWTLASNFSVSTSYYTEFRDAGFISNGFAVNFGDYLFANTDVPKIFNFTGTDTVRVQRLWFMLTGVNANLTMGQAVLLIRQPSGLVNNIEFYGGVKTYHDVVIDAQHSSSSYTINLGNASTICRDIYFRISGQQIVNWQQSYTSRNVLVQYLNSNTGYVPTFQISGNHTMLSLKFTSPSVQPRLYLYNNNTIDTLQLHHGMDVYFGANQTQTLKSLIGNGLCTRLIDLFSTSNGTQATLTDASGTNSLNFINFRDIRAQGGAVWEASNVNTNTNNTGWTIVAPPPINYYWVGGTGNWNDLAKWSLSSGGPSAGCLPTTLDNVIFDVNSFNTTSQSVNLVANTSCRNMSWTSGVTLNPTFQGNYQMDIQGDLQVNGTMTWVQNANLISRGDFILSNSTTWNHNASTQFYSDSTNNLLNTANKTFLQSIFFDARTTSSGPKWTLASDLSINTSYSLNIVEGQFVSGGYEINAGAEFLSNSGSDVRIINLTGTDTLRMRYAFRMTTSANTNYIHGNSTILLSTSLVESVVFEGGNKTYYDVAIRYGSTSSATYDITFSGNNTIRDLFVQTLSASGHRRIIYNNSSTFRHVNIDHYGSGQIQNIFSTGPHIFSNYVVETFSTGNAYLEMNSNNSFNTLDLPNGFNMAIFSSKTQTTTNFIPRSSCLRRSTITGNNSTNSIITQSSGTVNTEWITLQNHRVQGGASFNATDAVISNIVGWTAQTVQPITMYWVGGTGSWSDPNKWSFTSGGPGNGCITPKTTDHVVFDASSFTAANQTVTLNQTVTVVNMIWNNVAFTPSFTGSSSLTINGNLFINSAMSWNQSGTLNLNGSITFSSAMNWNRTGTTTLNPSAGNYTLDFAGKTLNGSMTFNGNINAVWTLVNDYKCGTNITTTFQQGKFYSNGYFVDFGYSLNANNTNTKLLDFTGTDTVRVRREWSLNATGTTLNMGGAVLLIQSSSAETLYFRGAGLTYGDLVIRQLHANIDSMFLEGNNVLGAVNITITNRKDIRLNGNFTIENFTLNVDNAGSIPSVILNGSNTFGTFLLLSKNTQGPEISFNQNNSFGSFTSVGRNSRLLFGAGKTQTFTGDVQILGTGSTPILINSTTLGTQATLFKSSGELCFDYVWIKDINATGGATYNAGANGINLGNNTGISFGQSCIAYYWVGNSGNWSDYANHWATRSGGSIFYGQAPLPTDHVVFDANSFSSTGQTVSLDVIGKCYNMTWVSVLFNPTLEGSAQNLEIYGDLLLSPAMNQNWTGRWKFLANDGNTHKLNTFGKVLTDIEIGTGNSSTIRLDESLSFTDSLSLKSGHFNTNGKSVLGKKFVLIGNNSRTLTLGNSEILLNDGIWNVADPSNLTLSPGTSEIILKSHGDTVSFTGGDLTYYDLRFQTDSVMTSSMTGSNSFNKLTVDPGNTLTLESGSTQTALQIAASGNCVKDLTIQSDTPGSAANFSKASGIVNSNFVNLKDNTATGGATFNANQAMDLGGNTGWNFPPFNVLDISINKTNPTCPTPNNGSATAVVNGGVGPFSYKWNTLSTLVTLTNLSQGTYSVTVTDASGCTGTAVATLNQPPSYNFGSTAQGETICFGASNGDVSVDAPGGLAPLSYSWSNGASTQAVSGLTAGTYAVTVIDAANCRAFNSATVSSQADINASNNITTSKCINSPVGFTASGTGSGLTYNWAFGDGNIATGQSVTNTYDTSGNFTAFVTVTASNGCKDSVGVALTIAPQLDLSANITHVNTCTPNTCNGQVILNPSGGFAPFTYTGPEFAHAFYGPTLSPTLFTKDNNTGTYSQNNQLSVTGNGNWNKRIYTPATFARVPGKEFSFKFYHPAGGLTSIGWHGTSTSLTTNTRGDLLYAFSFEASSLSVYEDNNNRSNVTSLVPGGYSNNTWYEVRIVLKATGAEYYLRKLNVGNYVLLYNSSYSTETSLRLGMCTHTGTSITDDWVISPATPIISSLCPGDYKYFVADANGCLDTFTASVAITDITLPVANCKNITVALDNSGQYNLIPTEINNNSTDDCGIDNLSIDQSNFDCADIGANTVELTVTDLSNNTASCNATVTVADQSAPQLTCPPSNETIAVNPGSPCTIEIPDYVTDLNPVDNCTDVASILENQNIPSGSYAVSGNGDVVNIIYTATDLATPANTKTCNIAITVISSEIDVKGNNISIADGDDMPSTSDHTDFGLASGMPVTRTFTIRNIGNNDLVLEAGSINIIGPDASVFMLDNITLPSTIVGPTGTLSFDVIYDPIAQGIHSATIEISSDDCQISIYDFAIQGELSCNLPSFTQCPSSSISAGTDLDVCNAIVNYNVQATGTPTPTLSYEFTGDTGGSGNGSGSGETFQKGTTTVAVTATNSCGTATCVFDIIVTDDQVPEIDCNTLTTINLNTEAPNCTNDTDAMLPIAVDNCNGNINGVGTRSDNESMNAVWPLGTTTITWTFTDAANNVKTCTQDVVVSDNDAPVLDCNTLTTVNLNTEVPNCTNDTDATVPVAVDNCNGNINGVGTRSDNESMNAVWPLGTTTITWTFTDAANNVKTCTQDVVVTDNDAPVLDCNTLTTINLNTEAPNCTNDTDVTVPVAIDNCNGNINGVGTRSDNASMNAVWPLGTTTITWTFTDAANNVKTCTQDVVVTDNDAPVLDCNTLTTINYTTEAPNCNNDTDVTVPVAIDNCNGNINGVGTRSDNASMNAVWSLGTTTITWTFTDAANNVKTCTQDVVVTDNDAPVLDCNTLTTINYTTEAPNCTNDMDVTVPVAVDNCNGNINGVGTRSDNASMNAVWPLGTTTITWTFTDVANNVKTCTQDVVVTDNDAPVLDCNTLTTINLNTEAPNCTNDTDATLPIAVDNCNGNINGVGTRSDNASMNAVWPLGTTTITWTFTDAANNVKTCTQDVVVTDNDAPVLDCNTLTTINLNTEAPNCTNDTDVTVPVAVDNCNGNINGVGTRSDNESMNAVWPLGTTTITWTFTDAANNVKTCTQDVVVTDNDAPVLDCNTLTTINLNTEAPNCTNDTDATLPIAVDNCNGNINGVGTRSDNESMNAVWPLGTTTITWTFTDAANNVKTCTQNVVVTDNDAPVLDCNTLTTINLNTEAPNCTNDTDATPPIAVDNCNGNINGVGTRSDNASMNAAWPLGTTTITWTFTDAANNVKTCTQDVVVTDNDAPVLDCNTLTTINLNTTAPDCTNDTDATIPIAVDNCNGNINGVGTRSDNESMNAVWPLGTTTITWTFTDAANNVKTCTQNVVVTDNDAPVLDCNTLTTINLNTEAPNCTNDTDATLPIAVDNCNGNINGVGTRSDNENMNAVWPLGTTTITWTFTDAANNVKTCTQNVVVTDNDAPVLDCNTLTTIDLNTTAPNCSNDTDATVPVAFDNCNGNINGVGTRSDNASINAVWPLGTTTITWTFTDATNNVKTCTQDVVVTDNDAPVLDCNTLTTINLNTTAPDCTNDTDATIPVAVDNCNGNINGVGTRSDNASINAVWPLGTTTITWTFTDAANNVKTCTQDVVVTDNDAPVFDCNTLTTINLNTDAPNCTNDTDVTVPIAVDNCNGNINGVGTRSDNESMNAVWPLGTTTITWTFTDAANNVKTCTQDVVVTDNDAPVIALIGNSTVDICINNPYTDPGATALDNCDGDLTIDIVMDDSAVDITIPGSYTVTFNVSDAAGNDASQVTRTVVVHALPTPVCPSDFYACEGP